MSDQPGEDYKTALSRIEARLQDAKKAHTAGFYLMLAEDIIRSEIAAGLTELQALFVRFNQEAGFHFEIGRLPSPASGWHVRVWCLGTEASWHLLICPTENLQRAYLVIKLGEKVVPIPDEGLMIAWKVADTPLVEDKLRATARRCFELLAASSLPPAAQ